MECFETLFSKHSILDVCRILNTLFSELLKFLYSNTKYKDIYQKHTINTKNTDDHIDDHIEIKLCTYIKVQRTKRIHIKSADKLNLYHTRYTKIHDFFFKKTVFFFCLRLHFLNMMLEIRLRFFLTFISLFSLIVYLVRFNTSRNVIFYIIQ